MWFAVLLAVAQATDELQVKQYDGSTVCEDSDRVKSGDQLGMHYTGTIDASSKSGTPGKQFDSSRGRGMFDTKIGVGQVIPGWDQGLIGLCKGAKATLVIPPDLGYGEKGAGRDIPGGATLKFDVEVVSVTVAPPEPNLFNELDANTDCKLTAEEVLVHFTGHGQDALPEGMWENEDKNSDGFISWEEFGGPKGKGCKLPSKDEVTEAADKRAYEARGL